MSAFPTRMALTQMLSFQMDLDLGIVDEGGSMADVLFNLIRWAESKGELQKLLDGARRENPGNPELLAFEEVLKQQSAPMPAAIDLSEFVTIHDIGFEGTIVAFAVVTAMEASLAYQKHRIHLSARYLYERGRRIDELPKHSMGSYFGGIIYVAENSGVPLESVWPYKAGARSLPKGKNWEELRASSPKATARFYRLASQGDILEHLQAGRPIIAEVNIYETSWMSDYKHGRIVAPLRDEPLIGGSAIVIVGYRPADASIRFANCWGEGWGDEGYGLMSKEVADFYLTGDMWAVQAQLQQSPVDTQAS